MLRRPKFCPKCKINLALHLGGKCPENEAMIVLAAREARQGVAYVTRGGAMIRTGPVNANATQVGGEHYKNRVIQPWDFIAANKLDFFQGSVVKYVVRFREKNGVEDLKKARHYLDKLIELESSKG